MPDPDHGLLVGVIVHMLELIKSNAAEAEEERLLMDANKMWKVGAFISAS